MKQLLFATLVLAVAVNAPMCAQTSANLPSTNKWGDQGNGTYFNPVMPADVSDLDAVRVGSDFYAISSTFQYSPGVLILHSSDLVNWRIIGHIVPDITAISPAMNWDRMDRAGRGIWAGSIRFHKRRFWVFFGTPDEGFFMSTAPTASGPWTPVVALGPGPGWDDPCPFWDDDDQLYLVATHFAEEPPSNVPYNIHLFKLSPDGERILTAWDRIIHQSSGSEANKLYKINGLYYHLFSEVHSEGRVVMMERSASLAGPWETRQLIHVNPQVDKEPNQGGLVQLATGQWYFLTHQGTGDWEGRAGALLPVTWIDGWPVLGNPGPDGVGNMLWTGKIPLPGHTRSPLAVSDDFDATTLDPAWEWNYQPRAVEWSLTERPGYLRLHAFPALRAGDFSSIGNVLTQRSLRTIGNEVTVKLDLNGMVEGQEAGIAHFAETFCTLGVVQTGHIRTLTSNHNGERTQGPALTQSTLWLRSTWDFAGVSRFAYSTDGATFAPFGPACRLTWGHYRGDRIALFTVNQLGSTGSIDFDSFYYRVGSQNGIAPQNALRGKLLP
jgi:beta-xylosidase